MTTTFVADFKDRVSEINKYFLFLKRLEDESVKLFMQNPRGHQKICSVDEDLLKTLKANSFLLLYNLVEASMRNAIEAIFDEMVSKGISFDLIRPQLKEIVIKNLRQKKPQEIAAAINSISQDIVTAGFDSSLVFSGNVDARLIRKTAESYGFSYMTDFARTGDGADLLTIKANRNDLAHGNKTFSEVGRQRTSDELIQIKNKVIRYLREILENIDQYIQNCEYKDGVIT